MEEVIKDIIARILEDSRELQIKEDDYSKGEKYVYYEILDMIHNRLLIQGDDPKRYGIYCDPFNIIYQKKNEQEV